MTYSLLCLGYLKVDDLKDRHETQELVLENLLKSSRMLEWQLFSELQAVCIVKFVYRISAEVKGKCTAFTTFFKICYSKAAKAS